MKDIEEEIIINGRNGKKTFKFKMNNHIDKDISRLKALKEICMWIDECSDVDKWFVEPLWELVALGFRIAFIPPGHPLFHLLDAESKQAVSKGKGSWLIFKGHIKTDHTIEVSHFGPLGKGKNSNFKKDLWNLKNKFCNMLIRIGISSREAFRQLSKHEQEKKTKEFIKRVEGEYMSLKRSKSSLLEREKAILHDLIKDIFGATVEAAQFTAQVTAALSPTVAKIMLRELTIVVLREISKEMAKITAKSGSKSMAKKIPFVGAMVGGVFAFGRLLQGDPTGAWLEVASGTASCVPGGGTAVSLGVDAVIAARDIKNAVALHRMRSERFERSSNNAQNLLSEIARIDSEYEVVKNALENPDFNIADEEGERFFNAIKYLF